MIHQIDPTTDAAVAPKTGNSGVSTVPTARFRVRPKTQMIEMTIRHLGKDASPRSTSIRLKIGEKWNKKTQSIDGNPHATNYLRKLRTQLDELFYKLDREGRTFTAQDLSDFLFNKRAWNQQAPHMLGAIQAYNQYRKPEVATGHLTETVFKRYGRMERIMKAFLLYRYKTDYVALDSLKPVLGKELESYFKTVKKYDSSTYVKYIRHYKTVLDYAVANEWTHRNPLGIYRGFVEPKPLFYLTESELAGIEGLVIPDPLVSQLRDLFIFCCWSGFAYVDLERLRPEHLTLVNDHWCLIKPREKQKRHFRNTQFIPLLPAADAILKKYAAYCLETGKLLPVPTNQHYNRYLKGIGVAANITRIPLKTHLARKTFTTLMLNMGLDMETIGSMVGHTSAATTRKYYAELHRETILERVLEAFKKGKNQS